VPLHFFTHDHATPEIYTLSLHDALPISIQDVPLAVTAVSGQQLENSGVQDLRDVTQVAPSLQMGTGQSNSSGTIARIRGIGTGRSEEHTSELQSRENLVCRLLLEKKNKK